MKVNISKRLEEIVSALPLKRGLRILEIGCGTGVAAREIVKRVPQVYVLGIGRSATAIRQCISGSAAEIAAGQLQFQNVAIENFEPHGQSLFDFAFAVRVGALDGRHPELQKKALDRIAQVLKPGGRLYIDGGDPLKEIDLRSFQK